MKDLQVEGIIQISITEALKKGNLLKDSVIIIIETIESPEIKEMLLESTEIAETTGTIEKTVSSEKIGITNMIGGIRIEITIDMTGVTIDPLMIGIMSIGRETIPGFHPTMKPGTLRITHLTMLETLICKVPALANSVIKGQDTEMLLLETLLASRGIRDSQSSLNVAVVEGHAAEINKSALINV